MRISNGGLVFAAQSGDDLTEFSVRAASGKNVLHVIQHDPNTRCRSRGDGCVSSGPSAPTAFVGAWLLRGNEQSDDAGEAVVSARLF